MSESENIRINPEDYGMDSRFADMLFRHCIIFNELSVEVTAVKIHDEVHPIKQNGKFYIRA